MQFKDAKLLLKSNNISQEYCSCDCCFSIEFEIENIPESEYSVSVYFNGEKIERSDNHYKVFEPSQVEYKGNIINKRNKYGFSEGTWINFYENGDIKEISEYPNHAVYFEPSPIWTKEFHSSGSLLFFRRRDTTESWFEDGQLRHQYIEYKKGDTTYQYKFRQYENHQLELKELKRNYPTIFLSEFDPDYKGKGTSFETVYKEEYFRNGNPASTHGKDTSYSWHENGKIKSKQYKNGKISYDWNGFVTSKIYHWKQEGPKLWGDLDHSLYVDYNTKGRVSKIHYKRDEANKIGISSNPYDWEWNNDMKLIESPENWKEDFPWKRFKEIKIE